MSDIEDILNEVERVISAALRSLDAGGLVSAKTSLNIRYLDEMVRDSAVLRSLPAIEPLIDVFEEKDGVRVVVLLPGVRKEDVKVLEGPHGLRLEVSKGATTYYKDVPCDARASRVKIESMVENNSVVEIVFVRRKSVPPR